jgi:ElaB/YqjD/DUF883 family membrane-anchored ribosome-binding protein
METAKQAIRDSGSSAVRQATARDSSSGREEDSISSAFSRVIADGEELLRATASFSAEGLSVIRARLQTNLDQAKVVLADARSILREKTHHAAVATEEYVITNPWKAIAIAGSVGLIVGLLLRRHR